MAFKLQRLNLNAQNGIASTDFIDVPTSPGDPVWGGITGTLSGQEDLQDALDAKVTSGGALGTPSSGVATNLTGTAANMTAGTVTTNANLTGHVTSTGNAAVLGSFTIAQLSTAISDANISGNNSGDNATNSQYVSSASFSRTFGMMGA